MARDVLKYNNYNLHFTIVAIRPGRPSGMLVHSRCGEKGPRLFATRS